MREMIFGVASVFEMCSCHAFFRSVSVCFFHVLIVLFIREYSMDSFGVS